MNVAFAREGVVICEEVLPNESVEHLRRHFDAIESGHAGARAFDLPESITDLIGPGSALGALATQLSGCAARPVRVLLLDKTPASNWAVPWHQDRTIAVKERIEIAGYGPWSIKDGVMHVEPPVAILEGMLTLRVFVDDCGERDGPLEVVLGSHRLGRLPGAAISAAIRSKEYFVGCGRAGDVLAMKSLAIHSSKRATAPSHRRVLHVDYATTDLAAPLAWMLN